MQSRTGIGCGTSDDDCARTAPKAKGVDVIEVALVTESNIRILSDTMKQMYEENGFKFFLRDAENILEAACVVLIGTREQCQGLNCGYCGFPICVEREEGVPCALNTIDVGIAIGSACGVAADHRVDTRVMFLPDRPHSNWTGWTAVPVSLPSR